MMLSVGDGIAAAAMFIAAGGFGIVIVKVRNGKNGKNGSNRFVQKDTCNALHEGLQGQMKMIVEKVDDLKDSTMSQLTDMSRRVDRLIAIETKK